MGREQKRKQVKKYKGRSNEEETPLFTLSTFIRIVAVVFLIIFFSYFILAFFVTKEYKFGSDNNKKEETTNNSNSVSNQILASNIFNQEQDSYYVYFYNFSDEDERVSDSINNLSETVYRVNTNSGFNSKYVTEDSGNVNAKSLDDLKVKSPTLIKISNDTIIEYYEGINSIVNVNK